MIEEVQHRQEILKSEAKKRREFRHDEDRRLMHNILNSYLFSHLKAWTVYQVTAQMFGGGPKSRQRFLTLIMLVLTLFSHSNLHLL